LTGSHGIFAAICFTPRHWVTPAAASCRRRMGSSRRGGFTSRHARIVHNEDACAGDRFRDAQPKRNPALVSRRFHRDLLQDFSRSVLAVKSRRVEDFSLLAPADGSREDLHRLRRFASHPAHFASPAWPRAEFTRFIKDLYHGTPVAFLTESKLSCPDPPRMSYERPKYEGGEATIA